MYEKIKENVGDYFSFFLAHLQCCSRKPKVKPFSSILLAHHHTEATESTFSPQIKLHTRGVARPVQPGSVRLQHASCPREQLIGRLCTACPVGPSRSPNQVYGDDLHKKQRNNQKRPAISVRTIRFHQMKPCHATPLQRPGRLLQKLWHAPRHQWSAALALFSWPKPLSRLLWCTRCRCRTESATQHWWPAGAAIASEH